MRKPLLVALVPGGFAAVLLLMAASNTAPIYEQATRWTPVKAVATNTTVSSRQTGTPGKPRQTLYKAAWSFRYEVDGRSVEGTATPGYETGLAWRAHRWETLYPRGTEHEVRYDPKDPTRASVARLDAESFARPIELGVWASIFVVATVVLTFLGLAPERSRVDPRTLLPPRRVRLAYEGRVLVGIMVAILVAFVAPFALTLAGWLELSAGVPRWVVHAGPILPVLVEVALVGALRRSRDLVANGLVAIGFFQGRSVVYEVDGRRFERPWQGRNPLPGAVRVFHDRADPSRAVFGSSVYHEACE